MDPIWPVGAGAAGASFPKSPEPKDTAQLREAAQQLEGVFLGLLLKSMRGTVGQGGLFGSGTDSQMYRDMFDQEVGQTLARRGGIGLADMIVRDQILRQAHRIKEKPGVSQPISELP